MRYVSDGGRTEGIRGRETDNDHPLYTWIGGYGGRGDKQPGDVDGQSFLGIWYVLSPAGKPIKKGYTPSP